MPQQYFGQPAAYNQWQGNRLMIPDAPLYSLAPLAPAAPSTPLAPGSTAETPAEHAARQRAASGPDGGGGVGFGDQYGGPDGTFSSPATIGEDGFYSGLGTDPEASLSKGLMGMMAMGLPGLLSQAVIGKLDPAYQTPFSALSDMFGFSDAMSQPGIDSFSGIDDPNDPANSLDYSGLGDFSQGDDVASAAAAAAAFGGNLGGPGFSGGNTAAGDAAAFGGGMW